MRIIFLICMMMMTLTACSSKKVKTEVKNEIASEPAVKSSEEVYESDLEVLGEADNLTEDQKRRLSNLLQKNREQNAAIESEILKTKSVLFKSLLDEKTSNAKLKVLEKELLKLNRKKTRQSLGAYREAKAIVGKSDYTLDRTLNMIDNKTIHEF